MMKWKLPLKVSIKQLSSIKLKSSCFLFVENTNETENPTVTTTLMTADEAFAAANIPEERTIEELVPLAELTDQDLLNGQVVAVDSLANETVDFPSNNPISQNEGNVSFKCNALTILNIFFFQFTNSESFGSDEIRIM